MDVVKLVLDHYQQELNFIEGAPTAAFVLVLITAVLTWLIARVHYNERIAVKDAHLNWYKDIFSTKAIQKEPEASKEKPKSKNIPLIAGAWKRPDDGLIMTIKQPGGMEEVASLFEGPNHVHYLSGRYDEPTGAFLVTTRRISRDGKGVTELTGSLRLVSENEIEARIFGTDGKDDLAKSYTERSTLKRINQFLGTYET